VTIAAGYATSYKAKVYSVLTLHVREKFLNENSLGLAEIEDLKYAWKMLPQVRSKTSSIPGLIAGVIEYGN